jgi:hypothetical protein
MVKDYRKIGVTSIAYNKKTNLSVNNGKCKMDDGVRKSEV